MNLEAAKTSDPSVRALEMPLIYFAWFIALSTLSLMIGLRLSISFSTASVCILSCLVLALLPLCRHARRLWDDSRDGNIDFIFLLAAFVLSITGGLLAASINRPDIDDSIYVPKAVFYLAHPEQPLDKTITWLAGLPGPLQALDLQYYEMIQGALAKLFGVHFLDVYHVAFPAIVGFLMCLSMLLFLSIFDRRKWVCLYGVAFLLLVMLALGETHMAYGNLSLARAFHAKYVFLALMVPAWSYFSLDFLISRDRISWLVLQAIGIGMAGATPTAMVFLPLLSFIIAAAYYFSTSERFIDRPRIFTVVKYSLSLVPVLLIAFNYWVLAQKRVGTGAAINAGYPLDFFGQLQFLINPSKPLTPVLFVGCVIVVLAFSQGRIFLSWWIGLCIVLLLNPFVFALVIRYVIPESAYWRLFYLIPFPLLVGLAFICVVDRPVIGRKIAGALAVAVAILAFLGPTSVLRASNGARFDFLSYKIAPMTLAAVKQIYAVAPTGSMFAPVEISSNFLILSAKHPQFHMREDYLKFSLAGAGYEKELLAREQVYRYLYERNEDGRAAFEALLSADQRPDLFVLSKQAAQRPFLDDALVSHGYRGISLPRVPYMLYALDIKLHRDAYAMP